MPTLEYVTTHCPVCGSQYVKGDSTTGYANLLPCDKEGNTDRTPAAYDRSHSDPILRACNRCAGVLQRLDMIRTPRGGSMGCYVSSDGERITTWTGETLAAVWQLRKSRTGFRGSWVYRVSAVGIAGDSWYGQGAGPGMCINMRRGKDLTTQ